MKISSRSKGFIAWIAAVAVCAPSLGSFGFRAAAQNVEAAAPIGIAGNGAGLALGAAANSAAFSQSLALNGLSLPGASVGAPFQIRTSAASLELPAALSADLPRPALTAHAVAGNSQSPSARANPNADASASPASTAARPDSMPAESKKIGSLQRAVDSKSPGLLARWFDASRMMVSKALSVPVAGYDGPKSPQDGGGRSLGYWRLSRAAKKPSAPFTIVQTQDGESYLGISADQLDRPNLFAATIQTGTGEKGVFSQEMDDTFAWYFRREGSNIQFVRMNTAVHADEETPEYKALKGSFSDSVVAEAPILREKSGVIYISGDNLFAQDLIGLTHRLKDAYASPDLAMTGTPAPTVDAYSKNVEVNVRLNFSNPAAGESTTLSDSRILTLGMHYSFMPLSRPGETSFAMRPADERVGYFTISQLDYTRDDLKEQQTPLAQYITRWNLEKKDPGAALSDVKQPITYWIDRTVPERYREAIKAGVLAWNAAFEAIGFKNAVAVKEVDKDMSAAEQAAYNPADIAYNVISWFMASDAGFAEGPSRSNPLTGEIFNAGIRIDDIMTRGTSDTELADLEDAPRKLAVYESGMALNLRRTTAAIETHSFLSPSEKKAEKARMMFEYVMHFVMHEVGHTLGLRHNMRGSAAVANENLGKDGILTESVMDYVPARVFPADRPQSPYYQTKLGSYDYWAIKYGYTPLAGEPSAQAAELDAIASESSQDPRLAYGTDEDVTGSNPDIQIWTLGNDPAADASNRVAVADRIFSGLDSRPLSPSEGYAPLLNAYYVAVSEYMQAAREVLPVIGGIRNNRSRPGDLKLPFEAVPASEQRNALKFLAQKIFSPSALEVSPQVLARMSPDLRIESNQGEPVPVEELISRVQRIAISGLFNPGRLYRLVHNRRLSVPPQETLSLEEMLVSLRGDVWSELNDPNFKNIPPIRRSLQRIYMDALNGVIKSATAAADKSLAGTPVPPEAVALIKKQRSDIQDAIKQALGRDDLDPATKLHLQQVAEIGSFRNPSAKKSGPR